MQRSTTLIQQLIVVMILGVTTLVHAQAACQPSTTLHLQKSLIQTQRNSRPENLTILTSNTQLNRCEFFASDRLTITDFELKGDTQNTLNLISIAASGPQSMVRSFGFPCANCPTKMDGLVLRITQTVNAYANNNETCKPNYVVQSELGAIYLQALNGCESLGIEHLVELVQTGPVISADPYLFNTSLATFKLSRPSNPTPIEHTIPLNSKAFLISPCKVVLRRSVKRL
jgi:hypothetical protein